jgi:hypothetical protein
VCRVVVGHEEEQIKGKVPLGALFFIGRHKRTNNAQNLFLCVETRESALMGCRGFV